MPTDSEFYEAFKDRMDTLGLPCPSTIFGSLSTATATIGAIAGAIKTFGTKVTVREIIYTFPLAAGGTAVAAATAEITAAVGGMVAAFYLGACLGCMLGAAFSVYGMAGITNLVGWLRNIEKQVGSLPQLLKQAASVYPRFSHVINRHGHLLQMTGSKDMA